MLKFLAKKWDHNDTFHSTGARLKRENRSMTSMGEGIMWEWPIGVWTGKHTPPQKHGNWGTSAYPQRTVFLLEWGPTVPDVCLSLEASNCIFLHQVNTFGDKFCVQSNQLFRSLWFLPHKAMVRQDWKCWSLHSSEQWGLVVTWKLTNNLHINKIGI